jgi:hypothetical protein
MGLLQLLLPPATVVAGVLGFWRVRTDLRWTGEFPVRNGILSH